MRKISFLILVLLMALNANSQQMRLTDTAAYLGKKPAKVVRKADTAFMIRNPAAQKPKLDTASMIIIDTASLIYKMRTDPQDNKWGPVSKRSNIWLFERDTWIKNSSNNSPKGNNGYYGNATLNWLNDVGEIELAVAGINKQNSDSFIYHIVMNDSIEIVPWTKPKQFHTNKYTSYAYLGKFDIAHKLMKVELYNICDYKNRMTVFFNDLYMPKATLSFARVNYNDPNLFKPHMQVYIPNNKSRYLPREPKTEKDMSFAWSDSINHIVINMENTPQNDMYNVYLKREVNGRTDTVYISNNWETSYYSTRPFLRINAANFNKRGHYEIIVVPEAPDNFNLNSFEKAVTFPFIVL